jgi:hypothetical protein
MKRVTFTEIDGDKPTGKGDYLRTWLTLRDESMGSKQLLDTLVVHALNDGVFKVGI